MMHITLFDQRTLRIRNMGSHYDRLAALPGARYDKPSKALHVPLCHLRRIVTEHPSVTVDRRCVFARLAMWRRWIVAHNHMGVWFCLDTDGETVIPTGEGVPPAFVEHVAGLSNVLAQFLGDQVLPAHAPAPVRAVEPTDGDRLIWAGMQNAAKAEERKAETIERARKAQRMKQMSLLEE